MRECHMRRNQRIRCPACKDRIEVYVDENGKAWPVAQTSKWASGGTQGFHRRRAVTGSDVLRSKRFNQIANTSIPSMADRRKSQRQQDASAELEGRFAERLTYRRGQARPFRDTHPHQLQMIAKGID
jgi:hypothetical protein